MGVFLFDEMIFGPVYSRRLGVSLGINLLPTHRKVCSFNCIYCECGWTDNQHSEENRLPDTTTFSTALKEKLKALQGTDNEPDSLTFAGNGEPTLHPSFPEIMQETLALRDAFAPNAKVSVLSNGSMLHKRAVVDALLQVDYCLMKLDGGTEEVISAINMPAKAFSLETYIKQLQSFNGQLIIQSLFLRGSHRGKEIDNTKPEEVAAWVSRLQQISPGKVMVYAIERDTPAEGLEKISLEELEKIAGEARKAGFITEVFA